VSLMKSKRTTEGAAVIAERAKSAAAQAVPMGKRVGTTAAQGARQGVQGAREWVAPKLEDATDTVAEAVTAAGSTAVQGVRQGVQTAREWAAPRIEDAVQGAREWAAPKLEEAADAVTTTVAPKVSSALRSTAQQVRPASSKTGVRRLLNWRWLLGIGVVAAGAGAAAAVTMRRRYTSATAEAKDATEVPDADPGTDPAVGSEANGRVTTPGT
jgi:hypothetical protein